MNKDLVIRLSLEQSEMLLKSLELLPVEDKKKITYQKLLKDVGIVKTMWSRRMKNDKLLENLKKTAKKL